MKNIVFVTGDKGGVGKSFFTRIFLDYLVTKNKDFKAFDTDKTNSTLFRFFESTQFVSQLDTDEEQELDQLLESLIQSNEALYVVDCAAGTMDRLRSWMSDVDFLNLASEHSIKVTLTFVLAPDLDCLQILSDSFDHFKDQVDYVVVKNLGRGSDFSLYESFKNKYQIETNYQINELELPKLYEPATHEIDRGSYRFKEVAENSGLKIQIANRSRVRVFRDRVFQEFEKVNAYGAAK